MIIHLTLMSVFLAIVVLYVAFQLSLPEQGARAALLGGIVACIASLGIHWSLVQFMAVETVYASLNALITSVYSMVVIIVLVVVGLLGLVCMCSGLHALKR